MEDNIFKDDDTYLKGTENWFIRAYFYLSNGLAILNEFRNLFLGIVAIYIALHMTNVWWMIIMFVPSVVILTLIGYYVVHKVSKMREWFGTRFSSHFGMKSFNYQEASYELLKEINENLKK